MMRTKPVDVGKVWTSLSAAVEQVRIRSERHNVAIAALRAGSQRQEVTPEFLAHLAFNHTPFVSMQHAYTIVVITRRQGTHAWCMGCGWFRCDNHVV